MRKQMEYGEKSLLKSLDLSGQKAIVIDPKTEIGVLAESGKGMCFHNKLLLVNGIVSGMPGIGRSWNLDKEIIPLEVIKEWRKERLSRCLQVAYGYCCNNQ